MRGFHRTFAFLFLTAILAVSAVPAECGNPAAQSEDGYDLWLRYHLIDDADLREEYFQSVSGRPIPGGYELPEHPLEHYESIRSRYVPGI